MRRRRTDDSLQNAAARVCALVQSDMPLSAEDRTLLSRALHDAIPDAPAEWSPAHQCSALAANRGPEWDDKVEAWMSQPSRHLLAQGPRPTDLGPPAKRLRAGGGYSDAAVRSRQASRLAGALSVAPAAWSSLPGTPPPVPYQEALPAELQDAIIGRLIESDPKSALALGRASALQATILDRAISRTPVPAGKVVLARQPAARTNAYLRASAVLGASPGDAPVAVVLCLMEAFVRFLFEYRPSGASRSGNGTDAPYGARLVDLVAADPRLGGPRDRARAWYRWIATTPGIAAARDPQITRLMAEYATTGPADGKGKAPLLLTNGRGITVPDDVAVGMAAPRSAEFEVVQPLVLFDIDDEARRRTHDLLEEAQSLSRRARAAVLMAHILLPQVYGSPERFINEGVRRHMRGLCRAAEPALPDFTSVFDMRFYIGFWPTGVALMASIGSPAVERLLF
ncbi:hypothetical protein psal_cds_535 [Pandoravirus salinus]|uniref:Uncharacterized protein n=1 Tax=Pandoravirus salinus TaxID=1349410 RepID=S4VY32_9VIRU|nr:hypothetical protein psal_cds_535 [Pandoravirus salinus]AGO84371.1 hypothetical protein psal_cds_535 [Pandoravirus salinus]